MKNKNIIKITDKSELAALVAEIKKNGGVANLIIGERYVYRRVIEKTGDDVWKIKDEYYKNIS